MQAQLADQEALRKQDIDELQAGNRSTMIDLAAVQEDKELLQFRTSQLELTNHATTIMAVKALIDGILCCESGPQPPAAQPEQPVWISWRPDPGDQILATR